MIPLGGMKVSRLLPAKRGRLLIVLAAVCMALIGAQSTAFAAPPSSPDNPPPPDKKHCLVVLGKAAAPGEMSPVTYEYCSPQPFDGAAHLQQPTVKSQMKTAGAVASTLLMTWHSDINWTGSGYIEIWGYARPCDREGYTYDLGTYWRSNISSIRGGHPYCALVTVWDRAFTHSATFDSTIGYLGSHNDNVGRIRVFAY